MMAKMFDYYRKFSGDKMIDWGRVRYFTKDEKWGNPTLIVPELVYELDDFRHDIGVPILVTCGTQGKHVYNSYHFWKMAPGDDNEMPKGLALDIMFPTLERHHLPDLAIKALKFGFTGVGIYPNWQYKEKTIGGMHVDYRPKRKKATWIGLGGGQYIPITLDNLNNFFKEIKRGKKR